MSGGVNVQELEQHYKFVDEARSQEANALEEALKTVADEEDREAIVERIRLLRDQDRVWKRKFVFVLCSLFVSCSAFLIHFPFSTIDFEACER